MLFTGFAANYSGRQIFKHVFTVGGRRDSEKLRKLLSARYGGRAILYHNGRSALAAAVRAYVPKGAKVAVNGLTCYAVVQAVRAASCEVVYTSIGEDLNFNGEDLAKTCAKHTGVRAVIIQNHLGVAADIKSIEAAARKLGLVIIEDLAHCAGAKYADGREVGTVGAAAALSFGKGKAIDTVTGGGLVLRRGALREIAEPTELPKFGERVQDRFYPFWGGLVRTLYPIGVGRLIGAAMFRLKLARRSADGRVSFNTRLTHWQAKLAVHQVVELSKKAEGRRQVASELARKLKLPTVAAGAAPLRAAIMVGEPEEILREWRKLGCYFEDIWYDVPVSPKRYFKRAEFPETECPEVIQAAEHLVNIPTHYTAEKLERAVEVLL